MEKYLGKKIYACEDLGGRYFNIGIIKNINENQVEVFCEKNPINYKTYFLKTKDFLKWVKEKYYKIVA